MELSFNGCDQTKVEHYRNRIGFGNDDGIAAARQALVRALFADGIPGQPGRLGGVNNDFCGADRFGRRWAALIAGSAGLWKSPDGHQKRLGALSAGR